MAMGRRRGTQQGLWIDAGEIARGEGHVFSRSLNGLLRRLGFDAFVEEPIEKKKLLADVVGRLSVAPGVYFRMSLERYFGGLGSERGTTWRCADSLGPTEFLGYERTQQTPDHSTLSRWRRKLPVSIHPKVFTWVVRVAAGHCGRPAADGPEAEEEDVRPAGEERDGPGRADRTHEGRPDVDGLQGRDRGGACEWRDAGGRDARWGSG